MAGWTIEVIIMLSQLSTKLKLKLKLSLAIYEISDIIKICKIVDILS